MMYKDLFFTIHWIPVVVVTFICLLITYGWARFSAGNPAKPASTEEEPSASTGFGPVVALTTFLLQLLAFANLSLVVAEQGWGQGILTGFTINLVWVLPALATANFNGPRSWKAIIRDGGLYLLLYSFGGLTLGVW